MHTHTHTQQLHRISIFGGRRLFEIGNVFLVRTMIADQNIGVIFTLAVVVFPFKLANYCIIRRSLQSHYSIRYVQRAPTLHI